MSARTGLRRIIRRIGPAGDVHYTDIPRNAGFAIRSRTTHPMIFTGTVPSIKNYRYTANSRTDGLT